MMMEIAYKTVVIILEEKRPLANPFTEVEEGIKMEWIQHFIQC
jgi:hypothetical protein